MADETTTGAVKEVAIDNTKAAKTKSMIRWIVIAVLIGVAAWFIYKKVLK